MVFFVKCPHHLIENIHYYYYVSICIRTTKGWNIILVTVVLFYLPSISMKRVDLTFISHRHLLHPSKWIVSKLENFQMLLLQIMSSLMWPIQPLCVATMENSIIKTQIGKSLRGFVPMKQQL